MRVVTSADEVMVLAAHEYALGRATYIVSVCIHWLEEHWTQLSDSARREIIAKTEQAIASGRAGEEMDVTDWKRFVERNRSTGIA